MSDQNLKITVLLPDLIPHLMQADPAEIAKASVAAPLFRFVPTTSQSAPILNNRKVPARVAASKTFNASMRHFEKVQEDGQEPSDAMAVDQDLANALQDLSSVSTRNKLITF